MLDYTEAKASLEKAQEYIKDLKKEGKVPTKDFKDGETPLHKEIKEGNTYIAQALTEEFPEFVDAKDKNGDTPLHLAARNLNFRAYNVLSRKATANSHLTEKNAAGKTPDELLKDTINSDKGKELIFKSIEESDADTFKYLLRQRPDLITQKSGSDKTLLELATESSNSEIIETAVDYYKGEKLELNLKKSRIDTEIKELKEQKIKLATKSDENILDLKAKDFEQAKVKLEEVENKIKSAEEAAINVPSLEKQIKNIGQDTSNEKTNKERERLQEELRKEKVKADKLQDHQNELKEIEKIVKNAESLFNAAYDQHENSSKKNKDIEKLEVDSKNQIDSLDKQVIELEQKQKDAEERLNEVQKAEFINAVEKQNITKVKRLLEKNPDLAFQEDSESGLTALCYAVQVSNKELVEALINNCTAETSPENIKKAQREYINAKAGKDKVTCLELLAANVNTNADKALYDKLIEQGAEATTKSQLKFQASLLRQEIRNGTEEKVKELVTKNPDILEVTDKEGKTALHYAAEKNNEELYNFLVNNKERAANVQDANGKTPADLLKEVQEKARTEEEEKTKTSEKNKNETTQERLSEEKQNGSTQEDLENIKKHAPVVASSSSISASDEKDQPSKPAHALHIVQGGEVKHVKFDVHEEHIQANQEILRQGEKGSYQKALSDKNEPHILETRDTNGKFNYSVEKEAPPPSETRLHTVEGNFGSITFNAAGDVVSAKLNDKAEGLLAEGLFKKASEVQKHIEEATKSGAKVKTLEVKPEEKEIISASSEVQGGVPIAKAEPFDEKTTTNSNDAIPMAIAVLPAGASGSAHHLDAETFQKNYNNQGTVALPPQTGLNLPEQGTNINKGRNK